MAMVAEGSRLVMRLSSEQVALIRRAAAVEGRSVTDFTVAAAVAHAQDVLGQSADPRERCVNMTSLQSFAQRADGSRLSPAEVTEALDLARAKLERRLAGPT